MKIRLLFALVPLLGMGALFAQTSPALTVKGPLPDNAQTHPFGGARHTRIPQDLSEYGYIEEEYLLGGQANVYDWPEPGPAVVRTASAPYTTRVLIRRPADPQRFSGKVVVEMLNPSNNMDLNIGWSISRNEWLRNGDAWMGVTIKPVSVQALKTFDPERYASLSWANPLSLDDPLNCENVAADSSRTTENGLVWDVYRQAALWLRGNDPRNPFLQGAQSGQTHPVKYVYAWGYSQTGDYLSMYVNAIHPLDIQQFSRPVFDAYLIGVPVAVFTSINQCSPRLAADDPRLAIANVGVPIIRIQTQSDYLLNLASRRPDSDEMADRFRSYEIAGAGHATPAELDFGPSPEDIGKAGVAIPPMSCNEGPRSRFPNDLAFNSAYHNLDLWVREGVPPPHAHFLQIENGKGVEDEFGNLLGGVRSPYVDVPTARWTGSSTGESFCFIAGHEVPFTAGQLESLYESKQTYVESVRKSVEELVAARFIVPADAGKILEEAERMQFP